jgi:cell wall-associated NlpC family hydrolase
MGRSWGGGPRRLAALLAVIGVGVAGISGIADAAGSAPPSPASTTTTTTLPPLPNLPPIYTNGQPAASLLSNAISLASLGVDDSALMTVLSATQLRLDADAADLRIANQHADNAAAQARAAAAAAKGTADQYTNLGSALREAAIDLYTSGPDSMAISPTAGRAALYARDYVESALQPFGVLAQSRELRDESRGDLERAKKEANAASLAVSQAGKAAADQRLQLARLNSELKSVSATSAVEVAADRSMLARQAGQELLSNNALEFKPKSPLPAPVSTTPIALTWAFAELGKEYVWGTTGPDTFDCSGLTEFVWRAAGVTLPRVAADQDKWAIPVPLSQLLPGDLVFFGTTDIHHVGIYIGDGLMINAPHTGTVVQVSSIWWSDLAGFGRVHSSGVPVPAHETPSPAKPAPTAIVSSPGPVPSQVKPPVGWKPQPGETTPIALSSPASGSETTSTTTTTTTVTDTTTTTASPEGPSDTTTTTVSPSISGASVASGPTTVGDSVTTTTPNNSPAVSG